MSEYGAGYLAYKLLRLVVERNGVCTEYSLEQGVRILHTVGEVQLRLRAEWYNTSHNPPPHNVAQSHNCSCHYLKFSGQNPAQLIEGECV